MASVGSGRDDLRSKCPVCDTTRTASAFLKDGIPYRHCLQCRLWFSAGAANANFETGIEDYPPAYLQYLAADAADDRNHTALLEHIRGFGGEPERGPVLDVGCGSGKLVRFLRERRIDAYGVEPAESLFARFLAGSEGFYHDIEAARAAAGGPFRLVMALDVLEHVVDPVSFLRQLREVVEPDGQVVLSSPDAGSATARALGRRWYHFNRFHLCVFSVSTLRVAAVRAGLRVNGVVHPGRYRALGYVGRYLFEFGLRRPSPRWVDRLDERFLPVNLRDTMLVSLVPS